MSDLMEWQKKLKNTIMEDLRSINNRGRKRGTVVAGPPGTGKTYALMHIISAIGQEYPGLVVDVTATTGAAASRLGGNTKTLATWLACGIDAMKLHHHDEIIRIIEKRNPETLRNADVLVVDEVSMLSSLQLHNIDSILKHIRNNPAPYGGLYMIIVGDPFQLPPVPHDRGGGILRKEKDFIASCLESEYDGFNYVVANEMKRSEGDPLLQKVLLSIISNDEGTREEAMKIIVQNCYKEEMTTNMVLDYQEQTGAIILATAKEGDNSVAEYNSIATERAKTSNSSTEIAIPPAEKLHSDSKTILDKIGGRDGLQLEEETLSSRDGWTNDSYILSNMPAMLRMNLKTEENIRVVNGDIGTVISLDPEKNVMKFKLFKNNTIVTIPRVKFQSEWAKEIGYEAYPVIPAAAMTVHKAQGATLENGIIFETRRIYNGEYMAHMLYTAFSRVKKITDIRLTSYLIPSQLSTPLIQNKLDYVWKLEYMSEYLRPLPE